MEEYKVEHNRTAVTEQGYSTHFFLEATTEGIFPTNYLKLKSAIYVLIIVILVIFLY